MRNLTAKEGKGTKGAIWIISLYPVIHQSCLLTRYWSLLINLEASRPESQHQKHILQFGDSSISSCSA